MNIQLIYRSLQRFSRWFPFKTPSSELLLYNYWPRAASLKRQILQSGCSVGGLFSSPPQSLSSYRPRTHTSPALEWGVICSCFEFAVSVCVFLHASASAQMGHGSAAAVWHMNARGWSLWRDIPGTGCWTGAVRVCLNWAGSSSRKETLKLLCTAFWAACWDSHMCRASTRCPTACIRWALQDGAL